MNVSKVNSIEFLIKKRSNIDIKTFCKYVQNVSVRWNVSNKEAVDMLLDENPNKLDNIQSTYAKIMDENHIRLSTENTTQRNTIPLSSIISQINVSSKKLTVINGILDDNMYVNADTEPHVVLEE